MKFGRTKQAKATTAEEKPPARAVSEAVAYECNGSLYRSKAEAFTAMANADLSALFSETKKHRVHFVGLLEDDIVTKAAEVHSVLGRYLRAIEAEQAASKATADMGAQR